MEKEKERKAEREVERETGNQDMSFPVAEMKPKKPLNANDTKKNSETKGTLYTTQICQFYFASFFMYLFSRFLLT